MAEVVLRHEASAVGLAEALAVDSAGTAADVGFDIDRRARRALERRGYGPVSHRARQFQPAWLNERDLVVAMDNSHVRWLENRAPKTGRTARGPAPSQLPDGSSRAPWLARDPDPWYGDEAEFESCLDLVQAGCVGPAGRAGGRAGRELRPVRSRGSPSSC